MFSNNICRSRGKYNQLIRNLRERKGEKQGKREGEGGRECGVHMGAIHDTKRKFM